MSTCFDCANCYRLTMICQKFNKSVADNSVHPWECEGFKSRQHMLVHVENPEGYSPRSMQQKNGEFELIYQENDRQASRTVNREH